MKFTSIYNQILQITGQNNACWSESNAGITVQELYLNQMAPTRPLQHEAQSQSRLGYHDFHLAISLNDLVIGYNSVAKQGEGIHLFIFLPTIIFSQLT